MTGLRQGLCQLCFVRRKVSQLASIPPCLCPCKLCSRRYPVCAPAKRPARVCWSFSPKIWQCRWRDPFVSCRSEEHTSELQSLMRISYAVFCLKKKNKHNNTTNHNNT